MRSLSYGHTIVVYLRVVVNFSNEKTEESPVNECVCSAPLLGIEFNFSCAGAFHTAFHISRGKLFFLREKKHDLTLCGCNERLEVCFPRNASVKKLSRMTGVNISERPLRDKCNSGELLKRFLRALLFYQTLRGKWLLSGENKFFYSTLKAGRHLSYRPKTRRETSY